MIKVFLIFTNFILLNFIKKTSKIIKVVRRLDGSGARIFKNTKLYFKKFYDIFIELVLSGFQRVFLINKIIFKNDFLTI